MRHLKTRCTANTVSGSGALSTGSSASNSYILGSASNANSESITVTTAANGKVTITGSITNSGNALSFDASSVFASFFGSINLNGEYAYTLTESTTAIRYFAASSTVSLNVAGLSPGSGFLAAGGYSFSGSASGGAALSGADSASVHFTLTLTPVPEPGTIIVLGMGLLGMAGYGWRRRNCVLAG